VGTTTDGIDDGTDVEVWEPAMYEGGDSAPFEDASAPTADPALTRHRTAPLSATPAWQPRVGVGGDLRGVVRERAAAREDVEVVEPPVALRVVLALSGLAALATWAAVFVKLVV